MRGKMTYWGTGRMDCRVSGDALEYYIGGGLNTEEACRSIFTFGIYNFMNHLDCMRIFGLTESQKQDLLAIN